MKQLLRYCGLLPSRKTLKIAIFCLLFFSFVPFSKGIIICSAQDHQFSVESFEVDEVDAIHQFSIDREKSLLPHALDFRFLVGENFISFQHSNTPRIRLGIAGRGLRKDREVFMFNENELIGDLGLTSYYRTDQIRVTSKSLFLLPPKASRFISVQGTSSVDHYLGFRFRNSAYLKDRNAPAFFYGYLGLTLSFEDSLLSSLAITSWGYDSNGGAILAGKTHLSTESIPEFSETGAILGICTVLGFLILRRKRKVNFQS